MKKQITNLCLILSTANFAPAVAQSQSNANIIRDIESQESVFRRELSHEESKNLSQSHSAGREKLVLALKLVDKQLNWVFENFANLNSSGYKKIAITNTDRPEAKPRRLFQMGSLQSTGNKLDIAISNSEGLFKVIGRNGEVYYRRSGSFKLNQERLISDLNGFILIPRIQLSAGQAIDFLTINEQGVVNIGTTKESAKHLGKIRLFHVQDPDNLEYLPDCLCFKLQNGAPDPTEHEPGTGYIGGLLQGFIEMSNVNESEERINQLILLRQRKLIYATIQMLTPKSKKQEQRLP